MQESVDEGEKEVDEMVGKVIKRGQSYDIEFLLGVVISYKEMKQDWYSKGLNL